MESLRCVRRHRRAARRRGPIDLDGRHAGLLRIDHGLAIAGELHVVELGVGPGHDLQRAAGERNHLDGLAPTVHGGEEQPGGIALPGKTVDPAVQRFGEIGDLAVLAFEHQQAPAVAFIAGAELRAPGEVLAVGRILRAGIGAGGGCDFDRGTAIDGHHVEIRVGAGGRYGVGIHGIADLLAVGRDVVIVGAAEGKRRNVDGARGEVLGRSTTDADDKEVAALAALPAGPMAIEQFGVDAGSHLAGFVGVQVFLIAGVVGAAFGIDLAGENQVLTVGGK